MELVFKGINDLMNWLIFNQTPFVYLAMILAMVAAFVFVGLFTGMVARDKIRTVYGIGKLVFGAAILMVTIASIGAHENVRNFFLGAVLITLIGILAILANSALDQRMRRIFVDGGM